MAYTKEKNIIKYSGRKYEFVFNLANGNLTTNHPNGKKFIQQTTSHSNCDLARLIKLAAYSRTNIDPYIETIMVAAPKLWDIISKTGVWFIRDINELITLTKQNWKYVLQLEKSTYGNPYAIDSRVSYLTAMDIIKIKSLGLNELEEKWYREYHNIAFVKKFAGQLEMYNLLLSEQCANIINWYDNNNIDIKPYLVNKNLLQVLKELKTNKEQLENKKIADGLINTYEKYKSLEETDTDGWSYKILNTYDQFKEEADKMHNCLIRCEYYKKMLDGKSVIMVATTSDGTRIDVELTPHANGKISILQAYYSNNCSLSKEHRTHLKKWVGGKSI